MACEAGMAWEQDWDGLGVRLGGPRCKAWDVLEARLRWPGSKAGMAWEQGWDNLGAGIAWEQGWNGQGERLGWPWSKAGMARE